MHFCPSSALISPRTLRTARWRRSLTALAATSVALLGAASPADATSTVYWTTSSGLIQASDDPGAGATTLISGQGSLQDIALDLVNGRMYWAERINATTGTISSANLDGSGLTTVLNANAPTSIVLDSANGQMFWSDRGAAVIRRANLDGSGVTTLLSISNPGFLALDEVNDQLYFTDTALGLVQRMNLDGSGLTTIVSGLTHGNTNGLALDVASGHLYVNSNFTIKRANLDGSGLIDLTPSNAFGFLDLTLDLDSGQMYWDTGSSMRRANLDGSNATTLFTSTAFQIGGIAIVPEPSAGLLLLVGLVGLSRVRR